MVFLFFLLNSGCFLLGPTYTKPAVNIPVKWPDERGVKIDDQANLPCLLWWKQFDSPELNAFIINALKKNGDPNIAIANIEYAQSLLQQIKLSWIPNLTLLTGYSQFPILGNPGNVVIAFPLYAVNLIQQYKQQKGAKLRLEASYYARDAVKLSIITQVSSAFFTLLAQKEALALYQTLLKDYRTYLMLARNQYQNGLIPQDTIDLLESQIQQTASQVEISKHNIVVSQNALHYLLNENPGSFKINKSFRSINTDSVIPTNLPVRVLNNRPDIRQSEALLRAANADVGAAVATLLPTLTLGAYLGSGSNVGGISLAETYLNTPVFDLPIFAQIKASKATYKVQCINYIVAIRAALRDVANDLSAYTTYTKQLNNNASALASKKRLCHLAKQRYRHGIADNIELVQCQINVDQFELLMNKSKLEKMIAIITLYQDLAGGYNGV